MYMFNMLIIIASIIVLALVVVIYKLNKIQKAIKDVYELPHGESIYSIDHHEFNSISLQYILIVARSIMRSWMCECVEAENYEAADAWKQAISEVEKLIKTKINRG